jgi:hypothetical protein
MVQQAAGVVGVGFLPPVPSPSLKRLPGYAWNLSGEGATGYEGSLFSPSSLLRPFSLFPRSRGVAR